MCFSLSVSLSHFLSVSLSQDGDKRVVLGKVLEVYDKLFDQMLSQPPTDSQSEEKKKEEAGIRYLQERVTLLRRTQYKKHLLLTSTLEQLGNIQVEIQ